MATISEMAAFMKELPEDTVAIVIVQRGRHPFAMRTEELDITVPWPNWPKAAWEGMMAAIGPPVESEGEPPDQLGSNPGEGP